MFDEDPRKSQDDMQNMPLYAKGWLIFELTDKIVALVTEEDGEYAALEENKRGLLAHQAQQLYGDAMLLCPKIAGEVEEFRILFAEWVKTFDPWNYTIDRWGLFNPSGVNYDDKDPDDDISFDSDDFFEK